MIGLPVNVERHGRGASRWPDSGAAIPGRQGDPRGLLYVMSQHLPSSNNWVETFRCDANTINSEALVCCKMDEDIAKRLAFGIALLCVRNTCIEDVHAGIEPSSRTGDFSDVKVVTPYGEIPWDELSRIRNDEMREFSRAAIAMSSEPSYSSTVAATASKCAM